MKKIEIFKTEGDKIKRERKHCPKCGEGVFLADHKDRLSCGNCGYTEFKKKETKDKKSKQNKKEKKKKEEEKKEEKSE